MGDSRLKVCTIHSFKGWELKNLIVLITDKAQSVDQLDKLVYTSLQEHYQALRFLTLVIGMRNMEIPGIRLIIKIFMTYYYIITCLEWAQKK